jgi:predicted glycogen debranching enzyme
MIGSNLIEFGREICGDIHAASRREWLVTNGIGGFASGTISGLLTRRYHGLLIAAQKPPLGRTLLLADLDEEASFKGQSYTLASKQNTTGTIAPAGFQFIVQFRLESGIPVWTFALADALIEKRVWMQPRRNTTYIQYKNIRLSHGTIRLHLRPKINYRDYHANTYADQPPDIQVSETPGGLKVTSSAGAIIYQVVTNNADFTLQPAWERNYFLSQEAARGEPPVEDHLSAGIFTTELHDGQSLTIVASTDLSPQVDGDLALQERCAVDASLMNGARFFPGFRQSNPAILHQLLLAANQFIVKRSTPCEPDGSTIIAGYPWFGDWGRDTMISLPGLAVATGRFDVARSILRAFSDYVDHGMLPNRFPDQGETPEYNTIDATLWYFEAIRAYHAATSDDQLLEELFLALDEIISWHHKGTRYQIHCDPVDGLIYGGEPGVQLTWMDAKCQDWVVTPRIGKPVEINALWYNALCSMAEFANCLGKPASAYQQAAEKAHAGFARYWNSEQGFLYDVLDGPQGNDPSLRPNQLFAISLAYSPIPEEQARLVLDACTRSLLTSLGLRSLSPVDPAYIGRYTGNRWQRDAAYHQGTIWGWLIGPFISAHLRLSRDPQTALSFLTPFFHHLTDAGLGNISEIFDGEPPFTPGGCIAQAWSVGEVLRILGQLEKYRQDTPEINGYYA